MSTAPPGLRVDLTSTPFVILGDGQKAALEQLSRRVSFERGVDVTVSDLVRDAVAAYLERLPERRIARIAETKVAYEARP